MFHQIKSNFQFNTNDDHFYQHKYESSGKSIQYNFKSDIQNESLIFFSFLAEKKINVFLEVSHFFRRFFDFESYSGKKKLRPLWGKSAVKYKALKMGYQKNVKMGPIF